MSVEHSGGRQEDLGRIVQIDAEWDKPSRKAGGTWTQPVFDFAEKRDSNRAGLRLRGVSSLDEVERLARAIDEEGIVALDLETGASSDADAEAGALLDPAVGLGWIAGVCLALTPHEGFYLPIGHDDREGNLPAEEVWARLAGPLSRAEVVVHHASMERRWLDSVGVEANIVHDTELLMARVDPNRSVALKSVVEDELAQHPGGIDALFPAGASPRFNVLDPRGTQTIDYAAADAAMTMALFRRYPDLHDDEGYQRLLARSAEREAIIDAGTPLHWVTATSWPALWHGDDAETVKAKSLQAVDALVAAQRDRLARECRCDPAGACTALYDRLLAARSTESPSPKQAQFALSLLFHDRVARRQPDEAAKHRTTLAEHAGTPEAKGAASGAIDELLALGRRA